MVQEFCCYALFELVAGGGTRTDHVAVVEAVDSAVRKHKHAKQCTKLPDKLIDAEKKGTVTVEQCAEDACSIPSGCVHRRVVGFLTSSG